MVTTPSAAKTRSIEVNRSVSQKRIVLSTLICAYLAIVVFGPLTNPISTEELTGPIGRALQPVHQSLFLGHGYRFFAPDPGPSHLIVYRIYQGSELKREGVLPDVQKHWPRVIYHRWFMLSETLFEELSRTPDQAGFVEMQTGLTKQIETYERAGQGALAQPLVAMRDRQERMYPKTLRRIDAIKEALGEFLLQKYQGDRVELFVQERLLPTPADISLGQKLGDKRHLTPPVKISEIPPPNREVISQ